MLFINLNAFSQDSLMCANPIKTICRDTKVQKSLMTNSVKSLKYEILKEAYENIKPIYSKLDKQYTDAWYTKDKKKLQYIVLNQEIMKSANSRIRGLELSVFSNKNISMIKSFLKLTIDESNFDQATRSTFKKTVDEVTIGSFNKINVINGVRYNLSNFNTSYCGVDGMAKNAFSTKIDNHKYVLICPGLLISFGTNISEQERVNNILFTVIHEIGHHIHRSAPTSKAFQPYLNCLAENNANDFKNTKEDATFCKKVGINSNDCRQKVITSHSSELIADQWAIQVLANFAKRNRYSVDKTDSLLKNNYINFCDSNDEGKHPSGDFRIGTLLRVNPAISDYLSCNNSKIKKPACTFDGPINL